MKRLDYFFFVFTCMKVVCFSLGNFLFLIVCTLTYASIIQIEHKKNLIGNKKSFNMMNNRNLAGILGRAQTDLVTLNITPLYSILFTILYKFSKNADLATFIVSGK